MCEANFKEKITVEKQMNSKHNKINCSQNRKLWEGKFCFAFDVIPGQEHLFAISVILDRSIARS